MNMTYEALKALVANNRSYRRFDGTRAVTGEEMEQMIDRMALGQAITRMSEFWQKIVALRYYRNLTQQQTADALGVTQVKISREEKKIVEFLRGELSPK